MKQRHGRLRKQTIGILTTFFLMTCNKRNNLERSTPAKTATMDIFKSCLVYKYLVLVQKGSAMVSDGDEWISLVPLHVPV